MKSYNAADPKQVKEAGKKANETRRRELDDVRFILSHKEGRRFVSRYLGKCGVFQSSFTGNSETFFREGQRVVGLFLMEDIKAACPEKIPLMISEHEENEKNG